MMNINTVTVHPSDFTAEAMQDIWRANDKACPICGEAAPVSHVDVSKPLETYHALDFQAYKGNLPEPITCCRVVFDRTLNTARRLLVQFEFSDLDYAGTRREAQRQAQHHTTNNLKRGALEEKWIFHDGSVLGYDGLDFWLGYRECWCCSEWGDFHHAKCPQLQAESGLTDEEVDAQVEEILKWRNLRHLTSAIEEASTGCQSIWVTTELQRGPGAATAILAARAARHGATDQEIAAAFDVGADQVRRNAEGKKTGKHRRSPISKYFEDKDTGVDPRRDGYLDVKGLRPYVMRRAIQANMEE